MAFERRPWQITMGIPATMSTRAALIFVIIPPEPTVEPADPAADMTAWSICSTLCTSCASGTSRGFAS